MDWEYGTLYTEIGSRAFSELAAENSAIAGTVIIKRCYRAGLVTKPKKAAPKALTSTSYMKTSVSGASTIFVGRSNHYKSGDILHVADGEKVLMVMMQRYSKKGNLVCKVLDSNTNHAYTIAVAPQDVLCSGDPNDCEAELTSGYQGGAH